MVDDEELKYRDVLKHKKMECKCPGRWYAFGKAHQGEKKGQLMNIFLL